MLLLHFADWANKWGQGVFPGHDKVKESSGLGDSYQPALEYLVKEGFVKFTGITFAIHIPSRVRARKNILPISKISKENIILQNVVNVDGQHKKKERKKTVQQQVVAELETYFSAETHIPKPSRNTSREKSTASIRWWVPLWAFYQMCDNDLELTKRLIKAAILQLRGIKYVVSAPQSIEKVMISLTAENNTGSEEIW